MYEGIEVYKKPNTAPAKSRHKKNDKDLKKSLTNYIQSVFFCFINYKKLRKMSEAATAPGSPKQKQVKKMDFIPHSPISSEMKKSPIYYKFNQMHSRKLKPYFFLMNHIQSAILKDQPFISMYNTPVKSTQSLLKSDFLLKSAGYPPRILKKKYDAILLKQVIEEKKSKVFFLKDL